jgi:ring-1,2-phenylacetyl-CoA epoxidase subunit PaaC
VNYGIAPDRSQLRAAFDQRIAEVLTEATLPLPKYPRGIKGGRTGHHSEHLGHLLAVMQYLPRAYPDARW